MLYPQKSRRRERMGEGKIAITPPSFLRIIETSTRPRNVQGHCAIAPVPPRVSYSDFGAKVVGSTAITCPPSHVNAHLVGLVFGGFL